MTHFPITKRLETYRLFSICCMTTLMHELECTQDWLEEARQSINDILLNIREAETPIERMSFRRSLRDHLENYEADAQHARLLAAYVNNH